MTTWGCSAIGADDWPVARGPLCFLRKVGCFSLIFRGQMKGGCVWLALIGPIARILVVSDREGMTSKQPAGRTVVWLVCHCFAGLWGTHMYRAYMYMPPYITHICIAEPNYNRIYYLSCISHAA